jgi:hypothetical protein
MASGVSKLTRRVKGGIVRGNINQQKRHSSILAVFTGVFAILATSTSGAAPWNPEPDLRVGLNGRTYPIGAQVIATAGLGQLLWGPEEPRNPEGKVNWQYGYARLAINAATSVVVNRIGLEAQVFPISILGLSAGYDIGTRNFTPKQIDCGGIECNGLLTRKYLRMQLLGSVSGITFSLNGRYEELRAPDAQKPFFDEMTLIVGRPSGEHVMTWTPALLYGVAPTWQAGGAMLFSHAIDTGGDSLLYGPVVSHQPMPEMSLLAGVGLNRSPVVHSAIAGFFVIQWMLDGGLAITDRIVSAAPAPATRN